MRYDNDEGAIYVRNETEALLTLAVGPTVIVSGVAEHNTKCRTRTTIDRERLYGVSASVLALALVQ